MKSIFSTRKLLQKQSSKYGDLATRLFYMLILLVSFSIYKHSYGEDKQIMLRAVVQESPPSIQLLWDYSDRVSKFRVYKRHDHRESWGSPITVIDDGKREYLDKEVEIGKRYEYRVHSPEVMIQNGYIVCGIRAKQLSHMGKLILVIDRRFVESLDYELQRFESDLMGDGWEVIRKIVSPHDSVKEVKNTIKGEYLKDPINTKALCLFGHIPVPYSGSWAPDAHKERSGAWPADVFYADMEGVWTDQFTMETENGERRNNIPEDGRFDQNLVGNPVQLMLGRIDLHDLQYFETHTEEELLRRYLDKNHAFRHRHFTAKRAGYHVRLNQNLVNWTQFFDRQHIHPTSKDTWYQDLNQEPVMFAGAFYGGGISGIGPNKEISSIHYANQGAKAVFTSLFGSGIADWDTSNNLMRSVLASEGNGLTCHWGARPIWLYHHMAMGHPIGLTAQIAQSNYTSSGYNPFAHEYKQDWGNRYRSRHIALMGDPTLRAFPVKPPIGVHASRNDQGQWQLVWSVADEASLGFEVHYKAKHERRYTKIHETLHHEATLNHDGNAGDFMVKAKHLIHTQSGSFIQSSQGVIAQKSLPSIVSVHVDNVNPNRVVVHFDRKMDSTSFISTRRYVMEPGLRVSKAKWSDQNNTLYLDIQGQKPGQTHHVRMNNIRDAHGTLLNMEFDFTCKQRYPYIWDEHTVLSYQFYGNWTSQGDSYPLTSTGNAKLLRGGVTGNYGDCVAFEGRGDSISVDIPDSLFLPDDNTPFTIEFEMFIEEWQAAYGERLPYFKLYQAWDTQIIFEHDAWGLHPRGPHLKINNKKHASVKDVNLRLKGKWTHVAVMYDGKGTYTTYMDGVLLAKTQNLKPHALRTNDHQLFIGNFKGYVDEIRLSSKMRTELILAEPKVSHIASVDLDGDGINELGEIIGLDIKINNPSYVDMPIVRARLEEHSNIEVIIPDAEVKTLMAQQTLALDRFLKFKINHLDEKDTALNLKLTLSDELGNEWTHHFDIVVDNKITLSGKVISRVDNKPIQGAYVFTRNGYAWSDENGAYEIRAKRGDNRISVNHHGYEYFTVDTDFQADTTYTIHLDRRSMIMSSNTVSIELASGEKGEQTLQIKNNGSLPLYWYAMSGLTYKNSNTPEDGLEYDWVGDSLFDTALNLEHTDSVIGPFQLQSPITWLGKAHTTFYIHKEGFMSFSGNSPNEGMQIKPNRAVPSDYTNAKCRFREDDDRLIVTFSGLGAFNGKSNTHQIIMHSNGRVKIQYKEYNYGYFWMNFPFYYSSLSSCMAIEMLPTSPHVQLSDYDGILYPGVSQNLRLDFDASGFSAGDLIKSLLGFAYGAGHFPQSPFPRYYPIHHLGVTMKVRANSPPVAVDDHVTGKEDQMMSFNVMNNDHDPDGDELVLVDMSSANHGSLAIDDKGFVHYNPENNFYGEDLFTYTISDGISGNAQATVRITVEAVNDAPITQSLNLKGLQNHRLEIKPEATDVDDDQLIFRITKMPLKGKITGVAPDWVYDPEPLSVGKDHFEFVVSDGKLSSEVATVNITLDHEYRLEDLGEYNWAMDINDQGAILMNQRNENYTYSVVLKQGQMKRVISPPHAKYAYGRALSNEEAPTALLSWYDSTWKSHIGLWKQDNLTTIKIPGDTSAWASHMNANGVVVGSYRGEGWSYKAFIYQDGEFNDLLPEAHYSWISSIDDSTPPKVLVNSYDKNWKNTMMVVSGNLVREVNGLGGPYAHARMINDHGHVIGSAYTTKNQYHAFLSDLTSTKDLTPDAHYSYAGWISGHEDPMIQMHTYDQHWNHKNLLWKDGETTDIGDLGGPNGYSYTSYMNKKGVMLGASQTDIKHETWNWYLYQAYRHNKQGMMNLNDLYPKIEGLYLSHAWRMNGRGDILTQGLHDGKWKSFVLLRNDMPSNDQIED